MAKKAIFPAAVLLCLLLATANYSPSVIRVFDACESKVSSPSHHYLAIRSVPVNPQSSFPGTTSWVTDTLASFPDGHLVVALRVEEDLGTSRFFLVGSPLEDGGTYCKFESSEYRFGEIANSAIKVSTKG